MDIVNLLEYYDLFSILKKSAKRIPMNTPKNTTSIISKQPSNELYDNATSIEMANKIIDAAFMASLNAHGSRGDRG